MQCSQIALFSHRRLRLLYTCTVCTAPVATLKVSHPPEQILRIISGVPSLCNIQIVLQHFACMRFVSKEAATPDTAMASLKISVYDGLLTSLSRHCNRSGLENQIGDLSRDLPFKGSMCFKAVEPARCYLLHAASTLCLACCYDSPKQYQEALLRSGQLTQPASSIVP